MLGITLAWFLGLVDRLIALATVRRTRQARIFAEVISPMFAKLELIAGDYFKLYTAASSGLREGAKKDDPAVAIRELIDRIDRQRIDYLPVRTAVRAMAKAMRRVDLPQSALHFAEATEVFFLGYREVSTQASGLLKILHAELEQATEIEYSPQQLLRVADFWIGIETNPS